MKFSQILLVLINFSSTLPVKGKIKKKKKHWRCLILIKRLHYVVSYIRDTGFHLNYKTRVCSLLLTKPKQSRELRLKTEK